MAVTYTGLTVQFGGDTKGLSNALKSIQSEARKTNTDLNAINQSLKFNPGSTDLLAQKVRNLNKTYDETKDKLDCYRQAMAQLEEKKASGAELTEREQRQYESLQRQILKAEGQLDSLGREIKVTSAEYAASDTTLYKLGQTLENNSAKFQKIGQGMQKVGDTATKYVTLPLVGIGVAAGKTALDVDNALVGVRKTVDATEEEYIQLKDAAVAYSTTHPISATDILAAEELAGQLGVDKENLQAFAEVSTGLDLATNMNVEQASTNLARFANVTNMSKLEGEAAEQAYISYGNVIVGLGNNLATTESEVSDFALRMASAGTQAGMTEPEILGIAGAMSSVGLEAASGGSAFSKTITDIGIAVSTGSADLEKYAAVAGMSAQDFADYWQRDATDAFIDFITGLSTGSDDMNVILDDLGITELRQSDALRRLAGNTDLLKDSVKLANEEWSNGTALSDEVSNKTESAGGKFEMLKNKIAGVLEKIGGPLIDALSDAVDASEPFLEKLSDMAQAFSDMPEDQQQFILKLALTAAAFGPVTSAGGKLVENLGTIGTGMKTVATAFQSVGGLAGIASIAYSGFSTVIGGVKAGFMALSAVMAANPIGVVVVAIAAVTAALVYFFTQTEIGRELWGKFTGWLSEKWQAVQDFLGGIPDWWNGVCQSWQQFQDDLTKGIGEKWDAIKSKAGELKDGISNKWEEIKSDTSDKWESIKGSVKDKWEEAKQAVTDKSDQMKSTLSTWGSDVKSDVSSKWESIKSTLSEKLESMKSSTSSNTDSMASKVSKWGSDVKSDVSSKWESIKSTFGQKLSSMDSDASSKWGNIAKTVSDKASSIRSAVEDRLGSAKTSATNAFESIRSAASSKMGDALDKVSSVVERMKEKFNFSWSLPHLSLPHLSVSGSFSLDPPSVPHFSIDWYKQGGVIMPNNPHVIGVGDATEREWIEPESKLLRLIQDAVRTAGGVAGSVNVEVNVSARVSGNTDAYQLGQNIGRGVQSVLKQQGVAYA